MRLPEYTMQPQAAASSTSKPFRKSLPAQMKPGAQTLRVLLLLLVVLGLTGGKSLLASANTLTNTRYGFVFSKLPAWDYLRSAPASRQPLDVVRLYSARNRALRGDAGEQLRARILLLIQPAGKQRLVEFARLVINAIRNKYFTVTHRELRNRNGLPLLYYRLYHEVQNPDTGSRQKRQRNIWMSVRFFRHGGNFYIFYGSAHTKKELEDVHLMFGSFRFTETSPSSD